MRRFLLVFAALLASCSDSLPAEPPEQEQGPSEWIIRVRQEGDSLMGRAEQDLGTGVTVVWAASGTKEDLTLTLRLANIAVP